MKNPLIILCLSAIAVLGTGCASSLTGDTYSRSEARRAISVREGVLVQVRKVRLEGTKSNVGTGAGAILGGVAGSGVGQGRGAVVGAVLGAVVGGVAGAATEEGFTRQDAWELVVQLRNGESLVVVQEVGQYDRFVPGERVRLLTDGGKTRVSPYAPIVR